MGILLAHLGTLDFRRIYADWIDIRDVTESDWEMSTIELSLPSVWRLHWFHPPAEKTLQLDAVKAVIYIPTKRVQVIDYATMGLADLDAIGFLDDLTKGTIEITNSDDLLRFGELEVEHLNLPLGLSEVLRPVKFDLSLWHALLRGGFSPSVVSTRVLLKKDVAGGGDGRVLAVTPELVRRLHSETNGSS